MRLNTLIGLLLLGLVVSKPDVIDKPFEDIIALNGESVTRRHLLSAIRSKDDEVLGDGTVNGFLQELASSRRPVVLTGLGINVGDYDLNKMESFAMDNVRWSEGTEKSVFTIRRPSGGVADGDMLRTEGVHDTSPTTRVLTPEVDGSNMLNGVDLKDFVDSDGGKKAGMMYWTGDLWNTGDHLSDKIGSWWKDFVVRDDLGMDDVPEEVHVPMVWLSHAGVAAQTHYDKSHNYFVQLYGEKKIKLFAPSYGRFMYSYPSLHAGRKQSMIGFRDELDPGKFPNATDLVAYELTLKAGEALYIPPYWWHFISTTEESAAMTLSVVSPSWEEAWLAKAMHHPMPLRKFQGSKVGRKLGVQAVLVQIISRIESLGSPDIFTKWLYNDRWANLYPNLAGELEEECFVGTEVEEAAKFMKEVGQDRNTMLGLIEAAKGVAKIIDDDMVAQGIRLSFMGDYVESLAAWAMGGGDGEEVGRFIAECLGVDSVEVEYDGKAVMVEGDLLGGGAQEL